MQSQTPILLNRANLPSLPADVKRPAYDVENVQTGIVHIGVGGFHRAHEAMYVDRLMAKTGNLSWGICGVGLRENDRAMKKCSMSKTIFTHWLKSTMTGRALRQ